jgi:hypothetical protein
MYLVGAGRSTQPRLLQLEKTFHAVAEQQIQLAIAQSDRLLDVIRAMVTMTGYLFSKEWYTQGYNLAGAAIRWAYHMILR